MTVTVLEMNVIKCVNTLIKKTLFLSVLFIGSLLGDVYEDCDCQMIDSQTGEFGEVLDVFDDASYELGCDCDNDDN